MDLSSRQNIQNLLKKRGLRPLKKLGQNFIVDRKMLEMIVSSADLDIGDVILEIGPGIGAITQELAKRAKRVVAVEKDRHMVEVLRETLKDFGNIDVVQDDILRFDLPKLRLMFGGRTSFKIVGNLPFYLTAPVIRKFLELIEARPQSMRPQSMTLVVQREVAQRICAKPPRMSILANSVQFYAHAEIISYLSKKSFWPEPEVDAAIVKITPRSSPMGDSKMFFEVVKAGFSHPRKQLTNNLSKELKMDRESVIDLLEKNNIRPTQRAETLSVEGWLKLAKSFKIEE